MIFSCFAYGDDIKTIATFFTLIQLRTKTYLCILKTSTCEIPA